MKNLLIKLNVINISLLLVMTAVNCGGRGKKEDKRKAHTVAAVKIGQTSVSRSVELFGTIYGEQQVTVTPKITGKVVRIVNPEGAKVREGDTILFILNDTPGTDYQPGPVLAPIGGTVGKIYVEVGQTVAPTIPVATIASFYGNVKVKAPISDLDLPYVRQGTNATISVTAVQNGGFQGAVSKVSAVLDAMSGSATVEVSIPNPEQKLIPGMACSINLLLEKKDNVIALPLAALFTDGQPRVLIVNEQNIAKIREVKIGLVGNELIEIKSGLSAGERVITTGKERVSDGDEVTVVEVTQ